MCISDYWFIQEDKQAGMAGEQTTKILEEISQGDLQIGGFAGQFCLLLQQTTDWGNGLSRMSVSEKPSATISYKGDVLFEISSEVVPASMKAGGPVVSDDKFSFEYTGKHDHGPLGARRNTEGHLSDLGNFLRCLKKAAGDKLLEESEKTKRPKLED